MSQGQHTTRSAIAGVLMLAAGVFAPAASALQITATYVGVQSGGIIDFHLGITTHAGLIAGQMGLRDVTGDFTASDLSPDVGDMVLAYCVDPYQGVTPSNTYTWTVVPPTPTDTPATTARQIKTRQIQDLLYHIGDPFSASFGNQKSLALQISLWEIISEAGTSGYSVLSGNTWFANEGVAGALDLAEGWLTSYVNDAVAGPYNQDVLALTHGSAQDLMVQQVRSVPAPASWLLLLPLLWLARRHRRR